MYFGPRPDPFAKSLHFVDGSTLYPARVTSWPVDKESGLLVDGKWVFVAYGSGHK